MNIINSIRLGILALKYCLPSPHPITHSQNIWKIHVPSWGREMGEEALPEIYRGYDWRLENGGWVKKKKKNLELKVRKSVLALPVL